MKKICVIDGQGGGIGAAVIKRIKEKLGERIEIIALGTNAIATANMLKSQANKGASGENAIIRTVLSADIIIGSISVVLPHGMMGEVTPKMAEAVACSGAKKILIPLLKEDIIIAGSEYAPLPHLIEEIIEKHL
ncbi:MAG: DUF3842 family protein [Deltaproteobacteria bacterium]|jgi:hypothetical protein|nr:DUF3842 family protein [Deltaproteobacteria bacterium]